MANQIVAMVPQIGEIIQGIDYDLVLTERSHHGSEITELPIDDPTKSFINDMNRDKPVQFNMQLLVSTIGINAGGSSGVDVTRLSVLYEKLLELKRQQVSDPDKLLTVYTGVIEFDNMAITDITPFRHTRKSQGIVFDLGLKELRFAKSPTKVDVTTITLAAGNGAVTGQNKRVANEEDRPLVEGTQKAGTKQTEPVTEKDKSILADVFL